MKGNWKTIAWVPRKKAMVGNKVDIYFYCGQIKDWTIKTVYNYILEVTSEKSKLSKHRKENNRLWEPSDGCGNGLRE